MCNIFYFVYQYIASTVHAKSKNRTCKHDITIVLVRTLQNYETTGCQTITVKIYPRRHSENVVRSKTRVEHCQFIIVLITVKYLPCLEQFMQRETPPCTYIYIYCSYITRICLTLFYGYVQFSTLYQLWLCFYLDSKQYIVNGTVSRLLVVITWAKHFEYERARI